MGRPSSPIEYVQAFKHQHVKDMKCVNCNVSNTQTLSNDGLKCRINHILQSELPTLPNLSAFPLPVPGGPAVFLPGAPR